MKKISISKTTSINRPQINPQLKRYVIKEELRKSVKLRKIIGGKYVKENSYTEKNSEEDPSPSENIFNRTKAKTSLKVNYTKDKYKKSDPINKDDFTENIPQKANYGFQSKKITMDEIRSSRNNTNIVKASSDIKTGSSTSKHFLNKAITNLENKENDEISDFTIQSTLDARRRYISTKKSLLTVKKGYYISKNIGEKLDSNKIKQINISSNLNIRIKNKKINISKTTSINRPKINSQLKRYVIKEELRKSVKLRKIIGGKYVKENSYIEKNSEEDIEPNENIYNRTKAKTSLKVNYTKDKYKKSNPINKDDFTENIPQKANYGFQSKKITMDDIRSSRNKTNIVKPSSDTKTGSSTSKYFLNKAITNLENKENDEISDFTIQSTLDARRRYISTKKSLLTVKKGYYISKNIGEKLDSNKIKQVNISSNVNRTIKSKKINIYKNYSLRNFLEDSLENKMIRNAKVDYKYTGDLTSEASKMTLEKGYDATRASKAIVYKVKKVESLINNGLVKDRTIKSYKVNQYSRAKNVKKQQSLAKTKYVKDLKRKELLKKGSKIAKSTSVKASRVAARSLYNSGAMLVKVVGAKFIIIGLVVLLVFLAIMQLMGGMMGTTSSYKIIAADKNMIINYKNYIEFLDEDFKDEIDDIRSDARRKYDDVEIHIYSENGKVETNFKEFLALNSVLYEQNLKFSKEEKEKIGYFYNIMNTIDTGIQYYKCDCKPSRHRFHKRLHIYVTCKSIEDILDDIDLNEFQKDWFRELMTCDLDDLYPRSGFETEGGISGFSGLSQAEIASLLANMPKTGVKREEIVNNAVSLVGKVSYFWGGKSSAGWNDGWGQPRTVTAPGTSDYGKSIPYGLDCSGFVDWAYKTSGINILGAGGTAYQWSQSYGIDKRSAKPGDLVFKNPPNSGGINHIGIYIGKDTKTGKDQFVHCSYSNGVTIDSWSGFKYYRRVKIKLD